MGKDRKLVYFKEDFNGGEFKIEEARTTIEELTSENAPNQTEEAQKDKPQALVRPRIEAIHAGATKNWTFYSAEKLKGDPKLHSGVYSWSYPYPKPMLKNHDSYKGEPLGRIHQAEFVVETPRAKRPGIIVTPDILDDDAAAKIRDGRYCTVSIGAHTDSITCSICGWDVLNDWKCPDHERGKMYDNQTATWILGNLWFDELSFVNVPADQDAMVASVDGDDGATTEQHEDVITEETQHPTAEVAESVDDAPAEQPVMDNSVQQESDSTTVDDNVEEDYEPTTEDKLDVLVYLAMVNAGTEFDQDDEVDESKAGDDSGRPDGKDGKPIGKMKTGNQKQAYYGHNLLHGWWTKGKSSWTKDQIKKEHARVVRIILDKGWKHSMIDGLDKTLSQELKDRSKNGNDKNSAEMTADEMQEQIATLTDKTTALERQLASAAKENQTLLRENAELETQLHRNLVEQVIDLKVALNKPGIENRDTAVLEHMTRTADSLRDMLADLVTEAQTLRVERATLIDRVPNPGLAAMPNEPNAVITNSAGENVVTPAPAKDPDEQKINAIKQMFAPKRL